MITHPTVRLQAHNDKQEEYRRIFFRENSSPALVTPPKTLAGSKRRVLCTPGEEAGIFLQSPLFPELYQNPEASSTTWFFFYVHWSFACISVRVPDTLEQAGMSCHVSAGN